MPCSGCSALHGVNPGLKKLFFGHFGPFLPFYCPPNPPTILKIKIKKKSIKCLEILSFYTCVPQMKIIQYMALEIKGATDRMFCHFGPFLPIYWQLSDVFDIVMFQNSEEKLWIPITELAILIADNTATSRSKSEIPLSDKQIKFLKWMLPVYMQVITVLYICNTYSIWYSFSDVEQVPAIHWEFWSRKSGNTCISNFLK